MGGIVRIVRESGATFCATHLREQILVELLVTLLEHHILFGGPPRKGSHLRLCVDPKRPSSLLALALALALALVLGPLAAEGDRR